MNYHTIKVNQDTKEKNLLTIVIHREKENNSLNTLLINEITHVLETANDEIKIIIIEGSNGIFCTGMDLTLFAQGQSISNDEAYDFSSRYMNLLNTLATINKIIIAKVDGKVLAGGIGLLAAADLVYVSPKSTFSLPELLWGLLPANVMPYLIRRIGFNTAYRMTLTVESLTAEEARNYRLVDEVLENLDEQLPRKLTRIRKLQPETILAMKTYFNRIAPVTQEARQLAVTTLAELMVNPKIQDNICNFLDYGMLPD